MMTMRLTLRNARLISQDGPHGRRLTPDIISVTITGDVRK
jgi:hypothetical protein